jgi:hypothetical protein
MANPTSFTFTFAPEGTFTFSNEHTTITAQTDIGSAPSARVGHCGGRND